VVLYSILSAAALIPLAASLMAVMVSRFNVPEEWLEASYELIHAGDLSELFRVWVVAAVLVAVGEEFVFRGVLQNSLMGRFSGWAAVLLSAAVFGILHAWRFPAAFVLGVFLGVLFIVTGSLVVPIVAHITINSVVVLGSYLVERAEPGSIPDWVAENRSAPGLVLFVSLSAFAVLMWLIRKAAPAGGSIRPGPDAGVDGAP
jgi:membrane protease YdiL (CAAX protease family)